MSIQEHLNKIRNAIYGREVRESIAKGIETAYDDASEKDNANMEVKIARGTHPNLRSRLEEVDDKQQQTTAQLAHTIKLDDSNLTLNNFTEEDRAVIQGLEPGEINAVLGEGNVLTENIRAEQVTPRKLKGYQTNNLLDFDKAMKNTYVAHVGETAPFESTFGSSSTGGVVSNKIYGVAGESYTISNIGDAPNYAVYFFNENDMITSYLWRPHSDLSRPFTFVFPEGSSYFLTNINVSNIPLEQRFIVKTSKLEYPDKYKYKWLLVDNDNIQKESINHESINGSIDPNLLEPENSLVGKYQGETVGGEFTIESSPDITLSNFIPCKTGDTFTISLADVSYGVYLYSDTKVPLIGVQTGTGKYNYTFTIYNQDAKYLRVNMRTSVVPLNEFIIAKGNTLDGEKKKLDWLEITNDNLSKDFVLSNTHKVGKTLVTFGNSRTWYDGNRYGSGTREAGDLVRGYQTYIREQLGMEVINEGVSSARLHSTFNTIKNYNFTGEEYAVSLMHGTNNFSAIAGGEAGFTLGEVDYSKSGNYDTMSVAGGYQAIVEYIATELPWLKLYLISDAWCYKVGHGGMEPEYADIMKEVAELYHYPYLDLYRMCGFNEHNMTEYFVDADGTSQFHENNKGYERTSEIIVPFIANH